MKSQNDRTRLKKTGTQFKIGLLLSLALALMAFNWTVPIKEIPAPKDGELIFVDEEVEIIRSDHPVKEKPPVLRDPQIADPIIIPLSKDEPLTEPFIIEKKELFVPAKARVITKTALPEPRAPNVVIADKYDQGEEILNFAQEMPRFFSKECEGIQKDVERYKCAETAMLKFCYKNLRYPAPAREMGKEGLVVVRFVVDEEGRIIQPEIIRPLGGGCSEEVLRIVNEMPAWLPGKQSGRKVKVSFTLPVRFKLER